MISYDAPSQRVQLSDGWGSTHNCSISEVWLPEKKKVGGTRAAKKRGMLVLTAGAAIGSLIGSIVTALLMR